MKKNLSPLIHFLLFFFPVALFSQSIISGNLSDVNDEPVAFANVLLLNATDSTLVTGNVTNDQGNYSITNIAAGNYILEMSMIGYSTQYSNILEMTGQAGTKEMGNLVLIESATDLNEVQIVAKKPLFEQKIDRMVVNVASSVTSAGNSALEVLERAPGVLVNRAQNQLTMSGKDGVVVMINGKESRMPIEGVFALLESTSADNIESIELIHTPPSNFDAEGNAGFINIVLKRNSNDGFNGSISANIGYGLREKAGFSTNLNYRKNKVNLFGNYSYSYNNSPQNFSNYRSIVQNGNVVETSSDSDRHPAYTHVHNARLGMDYQVSDKTVLGVLFGAIRRDWDMTATNDVFTKVNGQITNQLLIPNTEINIWNHLLTNVNLSHQLSKTQSLNIDLDYAYYFFENPSSYRYQSIDGSGQLIEENQQRLTKDTPMNIYVGKMDYTNKVTEKINLEMGVKGTMTRFDNDVLVESLTGSSWTKDPLFSSDFSMKEDISAAYMSISSPLDDKTDFKAGLRYEYTTTNLGTITEPNIVDRNYGKFFPSVFLSRRFNETNTVQLSYSRRINRPGFTQLAPYFIFYDPTTVFTGNSALQPSFTDAINLNYIWKTVQLSLGYSYVDESIAGSQPEFDVENNRQITRPRNFDWSKVLSATLSFPIQFTKWWSFRTSITWQYDKTQDNEANNFTNYEAFSWNANGSMNFTLPKDFSAEFSGFYYAPGIFGGVQNEVFSRINFGLRKKLPNNHGNLSLGVEDIFFTGIWKGFIDEPNLKYNTRMQFGERVVRLTYSRNFGSNTVKGARRRGTGSEEERRRVN